MTRRRALLSVVAVLLSACGGDGPSGPSDAAIGGNWTLNVVLSPSCSGRLPASYLNRSWPAVINQTGSTWTMSVQTGLIGQGLGSISGKTFSITNLVLATSDLYSLNPGQGQGTIGSNEISGPLQGTVSNSGFSICNANDHRFVLRR